MSTGNKLMILGATFFLLFHLINCIDQTAKVKVYRGATFGHRGHRFAPWGYYAHVPEESHIKGYYGPKHHEEPTQQKPSHWG